MRRHTNYIAYRLANGLRRIGSLDFETELIQPLSYASGTALQSLYEVIEVGSSNAIVPSGEPIALSTVRILPPISGRDILAAGNSYVEQNKEASQAYRGLESTAKKSTLSFIFTKRATSIIAHREPILPHAGFTDTLDFEGKIGVIIGKPGFRISKEDATDHVWGFTMINDVTGREPQGDSKQLYFKKSAETFCPIGPIAVPKEKLSKTLRMQISIKTSRGVEKRLEGSAIDLTFSVPALIETISQSQTLQAGDVLAVGSSNGAGVRQESRSFLGPGDEVNISFSGLGTLSNVVASFSASSPGSDRTTLKPHISFSNAAKSMEGSSERIIRLNSKPLHYMHLGKAAGPPVLFLHSLGGLSENFRPLIMRLKLDQTHSLHLMDLEGHGMSPTLAMSVLSIESFSADVTALIDHVGLAESGNITVIAHSMGCLIAMRAALLRPTSINRLILLGPPASPLSESVANGLRQEADAVRKGGMDQVVDQAAEMATSRRTQITNPLATAAMRLSYLSQDPEGYAKGCTALAESSKSIIDTGKIYAETFLITGDEDKTCPPATCETYNKRLCASRGVHILQGIGHWHLYEDLDGVAKCISHALGLPKLNR